MLAMRQILLGPDKTDWVNPYVTDGLIAMWDGEWNAGGGVHDPNATVWKDLVGTRTISLDSVYQTITDNSVIFNNSPSVGGQLSSGIDDILSCELCAKVTRNSLNSILFLSTLGGSPKKACIWYSGGSVGAGANKKGYPVAIGEKFTICAGASLLQDFAPIALNGVSQIGTGTSDYFSGYNQLGFGFRSIYQYCGEVYSLRVYNRVPTAAEIAENYAIDKARFNLP